MIYPAIVLSTENFLKNGTIRVRIAQYYFGQMLWDLSSNPDFIKLGINRNSGTHNDFDAYVFSPIGGGQNYGVFFLPQENTRGLVAFMGNTTERSNTCFWLGSIFQPEFQGTSLQSINFPSDKTTSNGANSDGFRSGSTNLENTDLNGAMIIKLKSTDYNPQETDKEKVKKALNWEKANAENTIVINKNKIVIHHSSQYDNNQKEITSEEILLDGKSIQLTIKKQNENANKNKTVQFTINKEDNDALGFSLKAENLETKTKNSIISKENNITLTAISQENSTNIEITSSNVSIASKKNTVLVDNKGITLNAPDTTVYLNAKEVRLGTENNRIVTTTFSGFFELPNGMVIKSSDRIFG